MGGTKIKVLVCSTERDSLLTWEMGMLGISKIVPLIFSSPGGLGCEENYKERRT